MLNEFLNRVNQFASTLPNSTMQFDKTSFQKELTFWERDPQAIHDDLIIAEDSQKQVVGFR
ncbi:hypothetical protein [Legionella sp. km772]|uniref:hypothetical protein n=1 Tax=Legionella sp. km772 TaxID=2498111 RepID=UPI000F8E3373|nr:hypothetical protein [Legionella sp. km772]RUR04316.1 hypothetical protein ELY15_15645 [Legionella sp. km772]